MKNEQWHKDRLKGLGGSDTPVVLGISPWKSRQELWGEKLGFRQPSETTPAMKRGTVMEPLIAKMYKQVTNRKLKIIRDIQKHPQYDWLIGSFDRVVDDTEKGRGILEIKAPGLKSYGDIERNGIPQMYYAQIQHYLAVSGFEWASFCAHNSERWAMVWYDLERDEKTIDMIINEDGAFWEMVEKQIEPPENEVALNIDIPKTEGKLITMNSPNWTKAVDQLAMAKQLTEEVVMLEVDAKAKIIDMMGDIEAAESPGFRIYHKWQSGRKTFDKKALAKDYPKIDLSKYEKEGTPFRTFKPYFLTHKEE